MKDTKPKPRSSKLPLREPAKPLERPEAPPPDPDHPIFSLIGPARDAETAQSPTTHHPPPTTQPSGEHSVAPARDFVRVPNSVVRDALPAGLFKGESKKTYDALYQRTRGAVVPRRMMRATLSDVMAWADVSHNTLKTHIKHLSRVGLITVHYVRGDNTGAEYEIFTPEEASKGVQPPTTHHPPPTNHNLGPPTTQNLVGGGWGKTPDSKGTYADHHTSFKTNTENDDDEALAALRALERELTGKSSSASQWREVTEVLVAELKIAAARTTVSSVPAFLAEHLRRRLWKIDKRQAQAEGRELPDQAGKESPPPNVRECADCGGTGWWYPEGQERGVAKCKHEKLTDPPRGK
jgi:hypothetical protein